VITLGVFVGLDAWNRCQPGWCGRFGVPFTYYEWSDEIPTINGVTRWPRVNVPMLVADVAVAVGAATAVASLTSKRKPVQEDAP
jgi:hypothetical protein